MFFHSLATDWQLPPQTPFSSTKSKFKYLIVVCLITLQIFLLSSGCDYVIIGLLMITINFSYTKVAAMSMEWAILFRNSRATQKLPTVKIIMPARWMLLSNPKTPDSTPILDHFWYLSPSYSHVKWAELEVYGIMNVSIQIGKLQSRGIETNLGR